MEQKLTKFFICSAGVILTITSFAKMISSFGKARVLSISDPILLVSFRQLFWIAATIELAVSVYCVFGKSQKLKIMVIAWLSTGIFVYRLGLVWIDYKAPCPCLGRLTDTLHISPHTADLIVKVTLAYLLLGSYVALGWLWKIRNGETLPKRPVVVDECLL